MLFAGSQWTVPDVSGEHSAMGIRAINAFTMYGLFFRISYAVFQNFIICLLWLTASTPYAFQWRREGVIDETFFTGHWSFFSRLRGWNFLCHWKYYGESASYKRNVKLLFSGIKKGLHIPFGMQSPVISSFLRGNFKLPEDILIFCLISGIRYRIYSKFCNNPVPLIYCSVRVIQAHVICSVLRCVALDRAPCLLDHIQRICSWKIKPNTDRHSVFYARRFSTSAICLNGGIT